MEERTLIRRTAAHRWRTIAWPKLSQSAAHISPVITGPVHSAPEQDERTTQGVKSPHTPQNTDTSTGRHEATCPQSSPREARPQRRQEAGTCALAHARSRRRHSCGARRFQSFSHELPPLHSAGSGKKANHVGRLKTTADAQRRQNEAARRARNVTHARPGLFACGEVSHSRRPF